MLRRLLASGIAIVMATAIFTGCSSQTGKGDTVQKSESSVHTQDQTQTQTLAEEKAPADIKTDIVMWTMPIYDGFEDMINNEVVPNFNKKFPNVKVDLEMLTYDAGPEKVMVAIASGTTPDIYLDGTARIAPAIEKGLCVDMSDVMKELDGIILPGFKTLMTKDGKNYCIPQTASNGYDLSVNTVLAKKLGVYNLLPEDKIHWSYEQFLNFNRVCYEKGKAKGIYPTMLYAGSRSSDSAYYSFLMSGGAKILNEDHTQAVCNSDAAVKALDVINTLVKEKLVPNGAATTKDEEITGPFLSGKLAYLLNGAGAQDEVVVYNKIKAGELSADNIQVEFFQYPTPDGKADPLSLNWGTNAHIIFKNKDSADKIAASKFFIKEFVTNPVYADKLAKGVGLAPVINVDIDYGDQYVNQQVKFANECNSKYSTDQMGIQEPWWAQVRESFFPDMQALFVGKKTSKQALDDFVTKANDIIAKAAKK